MMHLSTIQGAMRLPYSLLTLDVLIKVGDILQKANKEVLVTHPCPPKTQYQIPAHDLDYYTSSHGFAKSADLFSFPQRWLDAAEGR